MEPGRIWPNLVATRGKGQAETLYVRARRRWLVVGQRDVRHPRHPRTTTGGHTSSAAAVGDGPRCSTRSCGSRTTSTTAVTACTATVGRSRSPGSPVDELAPLDRALRQAMAELGYPACDDYHAVDATGVSRCADRARRAPGLDQRRLPRAGAGAGEPGGAGRRARRSGAPRWPPRGWRAHRRRARDRRRRGHRQRRRDPLARDPVAIGHRARRRPAGRREPQGPCRRRRLRDRPEACGPDVHTERACLDVGAALHLGPRRRRTERHADLLVRRCRPDRGNAGRRSVDRRSDARVLPRRGAVAVDDPLVDPVVEFRMLSDDRDRAGCATACGECSRSCANPQSNRSATECSP